VTLPTEQARIFLVDGMVQTIAIGATWQEFIASYIRDNCILSDTGIIERAGIRYIQRELIQPNDLTRKPADMFTLVPKTDDPIQ
jgi:hypothetical protein